ncbi:MAG TPA: MATE family efflux transporter [Fervidobacterium sp.]|nr:MATE family efflux transporter [Fervidobacterium sp.]HPT53816.1 MATE family efflux transporter [Fervidobacterium sp.]HRD20111.1 MATE family efflux transporter [Fervidobacterium sp.]
MVKDILKIAIPVSVENILANTGIFILTLLLSQVGEREIAINAISNQASFLVNLFLFGINTGGAIFVSQYWGKRDEDNIKRVFTLMIVSSMIMATVFFVFTFVFPETFVRIFSKDSSLFNDSILYLRIISFSYFGIALEIAFRTFLRGIEKANIPMESYLVGTAVQLLLAYGLLNGKIGLPKLGITGVAIAITISRYVIPFYQITRAYYLKLPYTFTLRGISRDLFSRFIRFATPAALNEIAWSLGMTMYGIVFGWMGTEAYAARNVLSSFENYIWTLALGITTASSVIVGKLVGQKSYEKAVSFSKKIMIVNSLVGLGTAFVTIAAYYLLLPTFDLTSSSKYMLTLSMWIMLAGSPIKALNNVAVVGILRAGGDSKYAFILETSTLWGLGVPLAFIGAMVWKQSLPVVYALTLSDEIAKAIIVYFRIRSKKWVKNVTISTEEAILEAAEHEVQI